MADKFEAQRQKIIAEQKAEMGKQAHLTQQNLDTLNVKEITPLTPEIISRQAT